MRWGRSTSCRRDKIFETPGRQDAKTGNSDPFLDFLASRRSGASISGYARMTSTILMREARTAGASPPKRPMKAAKASDEPTTDPDISKRNTVSEKDAKF